MSVSQFCIQLMHILTCMHIKHVTRVQIKYAYLMCIFSISFHYTVFCDIPSALPEARNKKTNKKRKKQKRKQTVCSTTVGPNKDIRA